MAYDPNSSPLRQCDPPSEKGRRVGLGFFLRLGSLQQVLPVPYGRAPKVSLPSSHALVALFSMFINEMASNRILIFIFLWKFLEGRPTAEAFPLGRSE